MEGKALPHSHETKEEHEHHEEELKNKIKELPIKDRLRAVALQHHH